MDIDRILLKWLIVIIISVYLQSWLPIIMIILPPFYGNTILMICGMTQHAGLADNVKDHRKSTRTGRCGVEETC